MARSKNQDAVSVTVLIIHNGPGGEVAVGDCYVTDAGHAGVLRDAGFVSIDNEQKAENEQL